MYVYLSIFYGCVCDCALYWCVCVFGMAVYVTVLYVYVVNCNTERRAYMMLCEEGDEKRCER